MKFLRLHPVNFAALSAALALLSASVNVMAATTDTTGDCVSEVMADGDCDFWNNIEDCGYDGGDCCECTCVTTADYTCGDDTHGGYACIDPSASCVNDDDVTANPEDDDMSFSYSYSLCLDDNIGDGDCDADNNNDECGYDGGDCCECDCVSAAYICGSDSSVYNCVDPTSSCVNGYVLASTKTTIVASTNGYDTRPGAASGDVGCGVNGCFPALAQDGISDDTESRWSCELGSDPEGGLCKIDFVFEDPQDIMEVQVAFYKGEERTRTLEVTINGVAVGKFDSYKGSTFNALGVQATGVSTLSLTSVGPAKNGWISLIEVRFLVEP